MQASVWAAYCAQAASAPFLLICCGLPSRPALGICPGPLPLIARSVCSGSFQLSLCCLSVKQKPGLPHETIGEMRNGREDPEVTRRKSLREAATTADQALPFLPPSPTSSLSLGPVAVASRGWESEPHPGVGWQGAVGVLPGRGWYCRRSEQLGRLPRWCMCLYL